MRTWTQGSGLRTHGSVKINTGESEEVLMSVLENAKFAILSLPLKRAGSTAGMLSSFGDVVVSPCS